MPLDDIAFPRVRREALRMLWIHDYWECAAEGEKFMVGSDRGYGERPCASDSDLRRARRNIVLARRMGGDQSRSRPRL
jgi:hypothetical protein